MTLCLCISLSISSVLLLTNYFFVYFLITVRFIIDNSVNLENTYDLSGHSQSSRIQCIAMHCNIIPGAGLSHTLGGYGSAIQRLQAIQ